MTPCYRSGYSAALKNHDDVVVLSFNYGFIVLGWVKQSFTEGIIVMIAQFTS